MQAVAVVDSKRQGRRNFPPQWFVSPEWFVSPGGTPCHRVRRPARHPHPLSMPLGMHRLPRAGEAGCAGCAPPCFPSRRCCSSPISPSWRSASLLPHLLGTPQPQSGASWSDALGYPFSFVSALSPAWLVGVAVALLVVYGACVLAMPGRGPANEFAPQWSAATKRVVADSEPPIGGAVVASSVVAAKPAPAQSPSALDRSVFMSHTSGDNAFGYTLADQLRAELGGRDAVWYDSRGGPGAEGEWEGGIPQPRISRMRSCAS